MVGNGEISGSTSLGGRGVLYHNQSIQDQDLERRLHMYKDMGLVDILPWNIPHGK